ncbi:unnamed protein product [Cuscuta campestris]|uniref:Uncharacterized protein n=1 Tax=Cuscuta campestris TaxID=132261 RepID=A0A484N0C7_9ASTE|nr:unnamed protein product [Cuscuta campestris]
MIQRAKRTKVQWSETFSRNDKEVLCNAFSELAYQTQDGCLQKAASSSNTDGNSLEKYVSPLKISSRKKIWICGFLLKNIAGNSGNTHMVMDEKKEGIRHVESIGGNIDEGAEVVQDVVLIMDGTCVKLLVQTWELVNRKTRLFWNSTNKCNNLPEGFEIAADFAEVLMDSDLESPQHLVDDKAEGQRIARPEANPGLSSPLPLSDPQPPTTALPRKNLDPTLLNSDLGAEIRRQKENPQCQAQGDGGSSSFSSSSGPKKSYSAIVNQPPPSQKSKRS